MKVDVAIQSYKKPESLVYTLLSLKKYCGSSVDTVYINDDCSGHGIVDNYTRSDLLELLSPIKIKVRINEKPSGYTHTIVTKEVYKLKNIKQKIQLFGHFLIGRAKRYSSTDEIRYQWAINSTDKPYIFLIHDDIKFFDDVLALYINRIQSCSKIAIVGDLGGSKRCPYGPCGKKCSPEKILKNELPSQMWPITGKNSFLHTLLGRYKRNCRINEWCCLLSTSVAKELGDSGIFFGNYEGGGDVGCYWFSEIIKRGYLFDDPLPSSSQKEKYYLHWWQGFEGHDVWVDRGSGKAEYDRDMIIKRIKEEFNYNF